MNRSMGDLLAALQEVGLKSRTGRGQRDGYLTSLQVLHFTSLHFTSPPFISLHFTTLHLTSAKIHTTIQTKRSISGLLIAELLFECGLGSPWSGLLGLARIESNWLGLARLELS